MSLLRNKSIDTCLNEAQDFIVRSHIRIENSNKDKISGWPQYMGKKRITEYGGTSSALSVLYMLDYIDREGICEDSLKWLMKKQNNDGGWMSSREYHCETTAGILMELYNEKEQKLSIECIKRAVGFINKCYDTNGYFKATLRSNETPHIYVTYKAVCALHLTGDLSQSQMASITQWIKANKSTDERWGDIGKSERGTVSGTIFALLILYYCGFTVEELRSEYKTQIAWIKYMTKRDVGTMYDSDAIDLSMRKDTYGETYNTLFTQHYIAPLAYNLFSLFEDKKRTRKIALEIIKNQYCGGWGPSKDRCTMWATQQAVTVILDFQQKSKLNVLCELKRKQIIVVIVLLLGLMILVTTAIYGGLDVKSIFYECVYRNFIKNNNRSFLYLI